MLELNPDIVCSVIAKAREFQSKEEVVMTEFETQPDYNPNHEWAPQVLAQHSDDLSLREAQALIADLEPDQQISLVVLMWIGRGDFGPEEWDDAFEQAAEEYSGRTADYLLATPLVSDYLEEGLVQFGYSCEE